MNTVSWKEHGSHSLWVAAFCSATSWMIRQKNSCTLCRRAESRSPPSGHLFTSTHENDAAYIPPIRTTSKLDAELHPLQSQPSGFANPYLTPARTVSYVPTTPLGKQVAASADAIRRRLLQTPASEARHAASQLESAVF